jgi:aminopeptidase-like protein
VKPEYLAQSFATFLDVFEVLENNKTYWNTNPKCEPQLGKRGLYGNVGAAAGSKLKEMALLWTLNLADGEHDLLRIAERSGEPFSAIRNAAEALLRCDLLKEN